MADYKCHSLQCTEQDTSRCPASYPHCWLAENLCVECLLEGQCRGNRPFCLTDQHRCVECLEPEHCSGAGEECLAYSCVPEAGLDFSLPDENPLSETYGQTVTFSTYRGQVVLLYFAGLA